MTRRRVWITTRRSSVAAQDDAPVLRGAQCFRSCLNVTLQRWWICVLVLECLLGHFAYDVRQIVQRQTLPGYQLVFTRDPRAPGDWTSHQRWSIRLPTASAGAVSFQSREITYESTRAIGDHDPRAIRDRILLLSGTQIGPKSLYVSAFRPL